LPVKSGKIALFISKNSLGEKVKIKLNLSGWLFLKIHQCNSIKTYQYLLAASNLINSLFNVRLLVSKVEQVLLFAIRLTRRNMLHKLCMTKTTAMEPEIALKTLVDKIIFSGKLSRRDHKLIKIFLSDDITEGDRRQINRVLDYIESGKLKFLDW
jgi:hypothetical protein